MEKAEVAELDDVPMAVVEEALEDAFGKSGKDLILSMLRRRYGAERGGTRKKAKAFQRALEEMLGSGTVRVTMSLIVEKMNEKREAGAE